jgi:hypothetical protein
MSRMTTSPCELLLSPACEPEAPHEETVDSRTLLKQYLLDPVLPIVTLLAIGTLAVVMLLLVVTTVGDMEQVLRGGSAADDPWSCAATSTGPPAYAAYMTDADATPERDAGPGPSFAGPPDAQVARDSTQR